MLLAAIAMCLTTSGCAGSSSQPPSGPAASPSPSESAASPSASESAASPSPSVVAAADRFLSRYVTSDGRVIRHDQGGDIVSEGQAYGMLIAELAGRPSLVNTIWSWTAAHLQRSDGLLKYHATGTGQIEDANPAADADALAAYALLRYSGADQARLRAAGRRIADAVLAHESVTSGGAVVVAAGTWATHTTPTTVNPSYLMPGVFSALAKLTGDDRWQRAASTSITLVRGLTADGRQLPTDWAGFQDGRLMPSAAPDGSAPVQYGLDAARLPLWFGSACSPDARQLAARWWTGSLARADRSSYLALAPNGAPRNRATNPVPLLAGAAGAAAAGDAEASSKLRTRAARQAQVVPTYYGDAWLALGGALLDGSLDTC
jgi:endoglucanase